MERHPIGHIRLRATPDFADVAKKLGQGARFFSDWRPVWNELYPVLAEMLRENIESQGASIGVLWPALLLSTIKKKNRRGQEGSVPLVGFGTMLAHVGDRKKISQRRISVWPRDKYAYVQHRGSPQNKMPAREFIALQPAIAQVAANLMGDYASARMAALASEISHG